MGRGRERGWRHPILGCTVLRGDRAWDKASLQCSEEMFGKHLEILSALPDE